MGYIKVEMPLIRPKWGSEVKTGCVSLELSGRVVDQELNLGVIHIVVALKAGELNEMMREGRWRREGVSRPRARTCRYER